MEIKFTSTNEDGTGLVQITATNAAEVAKLVTDKRLLDLSKPEQAIQFADMVQAGTYTHTMGDKNPYRRLTVRLDAEFTKPYADALARQTGYTGPLPDIDFPAVVAAIEKTHIFLGTVHPLRVWLVEGLFCADVLTKLKDDDAKALKYATDQFGEDIGGRPHEPEFIHSGNGQYKPNPNYLRHRSSVPAFGNPQVWETLISWWQAHKATPGQLQLLGAAKALGEYGDPFRANRNGTMHMSMDNYGGFHIFDPKGDCNYDGKGKMARYVKMEEFLKA
jgi:hypothetical protein